MAVRNESAIAETYEDRLWTLGVEPGEYMQYVEDMQDWIRQGIDQEYYSPDLPLLNRQYFHDVFIYGSAKKGMTRSWLLKNGSAFGVGYTVSDKFIMYRETVDNPESVVLLNGSNNSGAIYGEIYRVPVRNVMGLDFNLSNGTMFKRLKQTVRVKRGENFILHTCWMYVGLNGFWKEKINNPKAGRALTLCDRLGVTIGNRNVKYYNFQHKYLKKN